MSERPGGPVDRRPLHFIWLTDCSGSMSVDGKIEALNTAIKETIPHMRSVASNNPFAEVLVRAIKFSNGAQWHILETPVENFEWKPLRADGVTDLGEALKMVAEQLKIPPMIERGFPPVLVLVSDGQPTDDYQSGLRALMKERWGQKAVKIAIAIGQDCDTNVLQEFIGSKEIPVLQANNPETLTTFIKWASTEVIAAASRPPSKPDGEQVVGNVPIPEPPSQPSKAVDDVW